MSFHLELPPVPGGNNGPLQLWLENLRQRLNFLVYRLMNDPGCGIYFDDDEKLAVKHDDSTIVCDPTTGLAVDPSAVDHGELAGLADDDHAHYLKEKASGGLASEVPTHAHTGASEAGTLDHGTALTGLTDDDHTQYLKEKASGGVASEVPTHDHTGASEAGQLDHGAALTGLGDDDHTQYVAGTPATAARNLIKPSADIVPLTLRHYGAVPAAALQEWQDSAAAVLASISKVGKGTFVDADLGFTDPQSHLQSNNANTIEQIEEIAYVVKEQTMRWPHIPYSSRWLDGATYTYSGGADMFGGRVTDGSSQTIGYITCKIPQWYQKSGSNVYTIRVDYFISASPGADQVWRFEIKHRTYDVGDSGFGSYTTTTKDENVASGATANAPRSFTLDVTSGDFASGDEIVHFAMRRLGAHANDTYTGDVYVQGISISSGIKYT